MSRSAVVALLVGLALLVALAILGGPYWPLVRARSPLEQLLVFGLAGYGALVTAFAFRRVVDPKLAIPIVAYPVLLAAVVASAMGRADRREREGRQLGDRDEDDRSFGPDGPHMGRGWAIFVVLVGLGMCAAAVAVPWHWSQG